MALTTIGRAISTLAGAAAILVCLAGTIRAENATVQKGATMNSSELVSDILRKFRTGEKVDPSEFRQFVDLQNHDAKTGPAIGSEVPDFALPDLNGKQWTLHDLMGPNGMLLVFTRSADW